MQKVLVVANKMGENQHAVECLAQYTEHFQSVHLISFAYLNHSFVHFSELADYENAKQLIIEKREAELANLAARLGGQSLVKSELIWSERVCESVAEYAKDHAIDIVVKDGHRTESLFYKPTDSRLISALDADLLLVSSYQKKAAGGLLAAIDLGATSDSDFQLNHLILTKACQLAEKLHLPLSIGYAAGPNQALVELDLIDEASYHQKITEKLAPYKSDLMGEFGLTDEQFHIVG